MLHLWVRTIVAMFAAAIIAASPSPLWAREWTDATGRKMDAEFIDFQDDKVIVKKPDGKLFEVPLKVLCDADQRFLKALNEPEVSGTLAGAPIRLPKVELVGGTVVLRENVAASRANTVAIHLFEKSVSNVAEQNFPKADAADLRAPVVKIERRGSADGSETFLGDYELLVRFGKAEQGIVPGYLFLKLPEKFGSVLAGRFTARIISVPSPRAK